MKLTNLVVMAKHFSPTGIANIRDTFVWNNNNSTKIIVLNNISALLKHNTDPADVIPLNHFNNVVLEFINDHSNWLDKSKVENLKYVLDTVATKLIHGHPIDQVRNANNITDIARQLNSFTYVNLKLPVDGIDPVVNVGDLRMVNKILHTNAKIDGDIIVYGSKNELRMVRTELNKNLPTVNTIPDNYNHLVGRS